MEAYVRDMPPASTGASATHAVAARKPSSPEATDTRLNPGGPGYRRMSFALFAGRGRDLRPALLHAGPAAPRLRGLRRQRERGELDGVRRDGRARPVCAAAERAVGAVRAAHVMTASLSVAVAVGLLVPFAPSLGALIALRALQGAALAGLPASAMAYLAEEVRPKALVAAIGLFVAGNCIGGMSGRVITGWVAQAWGWRAALGTIGVIAVACAVAFRLLLPQPRHFTPGSLRPRVLARTVARPPCEPAAVPSVRDRRAVHDGLRRRLHGDRLPARRPRRSTSRRASSARSSWSTWSVRSPRPRPASSSRGSGGAGPCTWRWARRRPGCCSRSPTRSPWCCSASS